jgi:hypothetical protein
VAVPAGGTVSTGGPPGANPPDDAFAWFPGPDRLAGLRLDSDGTLRRNDGTAQPYALAPKLASNRSYDDASSARHLRGRTLSIRGAFSRPAGAVPGAGTFVARTIWPEDWRLPTSLPIADATAPTLRTRIDQAFGAAPRGPTSRLEAIAGSTTPR